MQSLDTRLVRRPREVRVTPLGEQVLLFIHRFGGMSTTPILFKYLELSGLYKPRKEERSEKSAPHQGLKMILRDLFDGGYLSRPVEQMNFYRPRRFPLVHRLSLKGEDYLKDRGLFSDYAPKPWGAYSHNMLTACVYQGYYLGALERGFGFTPQHEFVRKDRPASFDIAGKKVTPDALFSLSIEGKDILVFLEVDRGTEVGRSKNNDRKSYGRSAEEYHELIGRGGATDKLYKSHYKLPPTHGAQVHFVTTKVSAQARMLAQVARMNGDKCSYFLTHTCTEAGEETHAVGYLDMLAVDWIRWGMGPFRFGD